MKLYKGADLYDPGLEYLVVVEDDGRVSLSTRTPAGFNSWSAPTPLRVVTEDGFQ